MTEIWFEFCNWLYYIAGQDYRYLRRPACLPAVELEAIDAVVIAQQLNPVVVPLASFGLGVVHIGCRRAVVVPPARHLRALLGEHQVAETSPD